MSHCGGSGVWRRNESRKIKFVCLIENMMIPFLHSEWMKKGECVCDVGWAIYNDFYFHFDFEWITILEVARLELFSIWQQVGGHTTPSYFQFVYQLDSRGRSTRRRHTNVRLFISKWITTSQFIRMRGSSAQALQLELGTLGIGVEITIKLYSVAIMFPSEHLTRFSGQNMSTHWRSH